MLVFELENGSIINLLSWQSISNLPEYRITCSANKSYLLTETEFGIIKETILSFVPQDSIFKFDDDNIVNLMGFESLEVVTDEKCMLTLVNGTQYELTVQEFNEIKEAIRKILQSVENTN